ncbi:MAG TPA: RagB/SusD family nutrient uptake outer membrane protein [Puia sp.]|nr:RagB/SusD family nutrient uptake outer membrane protein [Puia sp.]
MQTKLFPYCCAAFLVLSACSKSFLTVAPQAGGLTQDKYYNKTGVQQLLVGAYHDLTGMDVKSTWWGTSATNWIYGDITSGDCYIGGTSGGGLPHGVSDALNIENFGVQATTGFLDDKWTADYDGVARANSVITIAPHATDMTDAEKTQAVAEARFLRGHFHFDAKKMWKNVPYVDETVTNFSQVTNQVDIWPNIEADFRFAYNNLPEIQPLAGQVNKWAAACYIAKCYLFEQKYTAAKALLDTIIANGKNAQGVKYGLSPCYHDNFDVATENNQEAVLQVQFSVDNASFPNNADVGETGVAPVLGYGVGSDVSYGYWKQPSFNLVNSFKTDQNGLPMMDASGTDTSNVTNMTNDQGIASSGAFTPYAGNLDPRLDWSVGRRGVPYLDWGVDPGKNWIYDQSFGGPYLSMKTMFRQSESALGLNPAVTYYYEGNNAVNYNVMRYADILLWAAECEVEAGSLDQARTYVNMVRARAMSGCQVMNGASPAANYHIGLYNTSWPSQDYGRNAIRFERRLEFALEGHRFFDLVRWSIADTYLNAYVQKEQTRGIGSVQSGAAFKKWTNEYFPVPQQEIILDPKLKQNTGY